MANKKLHLDFGLFNVDLNRVIRLIKEDLKDDWFSDPLLFDDRLKPEIISKYFLDNIEKNNGEYLPSERVIFNVPKKGHTLRHTLETNLFDRIAYHSFGKILLKHFDCLVDRRVLNHRLNNKCFEDSRQNRYLFLNSIEQWKKFEEFVRIDASDKCILETDLQNYYESISRDTLRDTLYNCLSEVKASGKEKARIRFCIVSIYRCLEYWTLNGVNGLPQNRDISSFLANIYMLPIDKLMIGKKYDYYRYMDDIRIICKNKFEARQALQHLIEALRERGLNVNGAKTRILEPGTPEHNKLIHLDSFRLERIDAMLNTKKKAIVTIAFQEIRDTLIKLVSSTEVDSREFRFYVGRICKIAQCKHIAKPEGFFNEITGCMIKLIDLIPHAMDQFYTYFASIDPTPRQLGELSSFLLNSEKAIYGWQNYQIWKILVLHAYEDEKLKLHAQLILNYSTDKADIAGATLYLGRFGDKTHKNLVISHLKTTKCHFLQRHMLISLQELPYTQIKKELNSDIILPESQGIYRNLATLSKPLYIEPPRKIEYTDLIREVAFYA